MYGRNYTEELRDKNDIIIESRQFVHFSKVDSTMPVGPYKYEGYRHGSHVFSVPGMDFISRDFCSENIEVLPWKRWRKPKFHLKRVLDFKGVSLEGINR